ncbi:MAG: HPP family protein [Acidobacteriaceae bacterium]
MKNLCASVVDSWGTKVKFSLQAYLWFLILLAALALLTRNQYGLYLVPPFLATLSILHFLPDVAIAQPYAVVSGSVVGASIGTLVSRLGHGPIFAALAAATAFIVLHQLRAYHPPGVALALYPALLHTLSTFPFLVVLPFTVLAVGATTLFSKLSPQWPQYPLPLKKDTPSVNPSFQSSEL